MNRWLRSTPGKERSRDVDPFFCIAAGLSLIPSLRDGPCVFPDREQGLTHDGLTHDGLTVTENQVVRSVSIFVEPLVIIGLVAPCFFCLIGKFTGRRSRAKVRPRSTPQGTRVGKERQKDQTKKGDNKRDKKRDGKRNEKRDGKRESTRGGYAR